MYIEHSARFELHVHQSNVYPMHIQPNLNRMYSDVHRNNAHPKHIWTGFASDVHLPVCVGDSASLVGFAHLKDKKKILLRHTTADKYSLQNKRENGRLAPARAALAEQTWSSIRRGGLPARLAWRVLRCVL
jgi:hypothetical protein